MTSRKNHSRTIILTLGLVLAVVALSFAGWRVGASEMDWRWLAQPASTVPAQPQAKRAGQSVASALGAKLRGLNLFGSLKSAGLTGAPSAGGEALDFDGANDFVQMAHSASLHNYITSGELTIEYWINPTAATGAYRDVISKRFSNNTGGFLVEADPNTNSFHHFIHTNGGYRWVDVTYDANAWQHIAFVAKQGDAIRVYKNGVLQASTSLAGVAFTPSTNVLRLMSDTRANQFYLNGKLDEVRLWSRALCVAEIQQQMNCELTGAESGLAAYYNFNQGTAGSNNAGVTTLTDATTNANHGTLTNFALTGSTSNWVGPGGVVTGTACGIPVFPEINLKGSGNSIADGTTATSTTNNTDFGTAGVGGGVSKSFTIENTGIGPLTVSAISFTGTNASEYAVSGITLPATIAASGSTTFNATFTPTATGTRTATVNITNNDCDEGNYDFALTGTGVANSPPTITRSNAAVSANEGATAANSGTFSDAQGNNTVTLSASLGTVTKDDALGTWSWTYPTPDGPDGPTTVTITASDGSLTATATFTLTVNNVAPKLNSCGPPSFTLVNTGIGGWAAAPADLDGDGDQDIVMGYPGGGLSPMPFRNNGNGTFTQLPQLAERCPCGFDAAHRRLQW